jgi:hypothetical protein
MKPAFLSASAVAIFLMSACSDDSASGSPDLIEADAGSDGSATADASSDGGPDASSDDAAISDIAEDAATADVGDVLGEDIATADTDPSSDVGADAIDDVVESDTGVAADVVDDAIGDVATDAAVDTGADTTADAGTDAVDDTGPIEYLTPGTLSMSGLTSLPWLMNVSPDGVSVMWETSAAANGEVYWGYAPDELIGVTSEGVSRTTHEVRLTGLRSATTVWYAVGQDGRAISPLSFRTAPVPSTDSAYTFVVWGDNQNGPGTFDDFTPMMAELDPDFAVSTGDCVQNGTRREYREQLLVPIGPLASRVPFLVGAGNHERYSDPGAALFNEYMSQPGDEHCFGWRYGDLYLVFIDTELSFEPGTAQNTCIVNAFSSPEATSARFQGAVFHKPPRIEYWFGGVIAFPDSMEAPRVREYLEPLFETLGVDIVFNGHNHLYAHTPETDGGITWVTTGGAGGSLDSLSFIWKVGDWPQIETQISEFHFLHAEVSDGVMTITAIDRDGEPIHQFSIER